MFYIFSFLLLMPGTIKAHTGDDYYGHHMMNFNSGFGSMMGWGGAGIFGGWLMLVFWILVIVVLILLIKRLVAGQSDSQTNTSQTALNVLKERYAKSEISKQEFEEKKKDLEK